MVRLTIRIDFDNAGNFGPGKAKLLELVEKLGSIRKAASAMKMSYRQAWLLLRAVEETFGAPVIDTATGGAKGGGARLTPLGRSVVERYRSIEAQALKVAASDISSLAKTASPSKRR